VTTARFLPLPPVLLLTLAIASGQALPPKSDPPAALEIEPVPAREGVPFGTPEGVLPTIPDSLEIENDGSIEFNNAAATITYSGSVAVRADNGMQIFAERMVLDTKAKTLTLDDRVSVYQGAILQRGDHAVYNYETKVLDASGLRISIDPILLESGRFHAEEKDGEMVFVGQDAGITTHDFSDPNYWIRSETTTVYPGEKITFKNLKLYAGGVPVFWFPYLSQPLDSDLGYHIVPGGRSNWGVYLLNTYGIMLGGGEGEDGSFLDDENGNPWLLSRWHFDLRSRRGAAAGVDLLDTRTMDNPALTGFKFYYANDLDPSVRSSARPRGFVNEDRWQLDFHHSIPLCPKFDKESEYLLRFNISKLSDRYYLEDFDPRRYRTDPEPDNTVGLFRRTDTSLLSFYARLPLNPFYQSAARLPELVFEQSRRPILGTSILHEGQTSIGIYREEPADFETDRLNIAIDRLPAGDPRIPGLASQLLPQGYHRFHTYQELSLPATLGGGLTLVPRVGAGYTNYWQVENPSTSTDRGILHAGLEASLKFSRIFPEIHNRTLGLDGLLHLVQPYANYSYLATDDLAPTFPHIDRLTFTTRPSPLSVGDFTAIDDLRDWNILRLGVRNRLITKRDGHNYEWLLLDTYIDAFLQDPEFDRHYSNLYNDLWWRPIPWLSVGLETQFPILESGSGFNEFNTTVNFMPNENLEFTLRYRMLNNHPVLRDSNRVDLRAYARLNENWGVGALQMWELDDGTLEIQQYTINRDLGNWIAGIGFSRRDNRLDTEYGVVLSLTLKDFPSVSLPFKIDSQ